MAIGDAISASPAVSGTTSTSTSSSSSNGLGSSASSTIAGNFQTFLTLLTTQLQNQNPLDPLDTNQFTQQLVQFAGVEQQLKTNDQLASLLTMQQATQSTQALAFVGKTAVVSGSTAALSSGKANWDLSIPKDCTMTATITNSVGQTVFSGTYNATAGDNQPYSWSGQGSDGTQWPDGQYKLTVTAKDSSGNPVAVSTQIQGTVSSVDLTQQPPLLSIGGQTYTVSQIQRIVS
ncbi:flagellar hook assembly protein [Bradyrhizobium sp. SSBR45G]|uniref:flagellar hook assembly protein FlgD n=1 Tax=unclassified Bradyrhizobium TaxID=2631580 RepID=UPI002342A05B|nr:MULTISPECIES: flagellar hook capping FlgD N-terminal domain-containing protein [unclassified Bradyrhizobium]GLH79705.1 flagellar hook assembly protein [Bradyrhizobium sp. SSBR45G]GLH87177.1 flagellar hook assembly protein [Bradyrhizobium sp. SSBR45R]